MSLFRRDYTREKEEDIYFFINFSRKDSAQEKIVISNF